MVPGDLHVRLDGSVQSIRLAFRLCLDGSYLKRELLKTERSFLRVLAFTRATENSAVRTPGCLVVCRVDVPEL